MQMPLSTDQWRSIINGLMQKNEITDNATIYLQITRGPQDKRDHHIPEIYTPTVFANITPAKVKSYQDLSIGFAAITLDDPRRRDCHIKATCLLPNVLAQYQANQNNALEEMFEEVPSNIPSDQMTTIILKEIQMFFVESFCL